ncbi:MAG: hypothetical protein MK008_09790 [Bdellovibrionales bacterium]|nr:hypothetical protein [Bdellovibrionales bacterium]
MVKLIGLLFSQNLYASRLDQVVERSAMELSNLAVVASAIPFLIAAICLYLGKKEIATNFGFGGVAGLFLVLAREPLIGLLKSMFGA